MKSELSQELYDYLTNAKNGPEIIQSMKRIIADKYGTQRKCAESIGITPKSLNDVLKGRKKPLDAAKTIIKNLELDETAFLNTKPSSNLLYRFLEASRNLSEAQQRQIQEMIKTFKAAAGLRKKDPLPEEALEIVTQAILEMPVIRQDNEK